MADAKRREQAIALYDAYTHGGDRRTFMAAVTRLAGGAAAAELLIARIAADPAAAAIVAEDDPRIRGTTISIDVAPGRGISAYRAAPAAGGVRPGVVVLHENRGLQPYTRYVARRLALAGFVALAPDLLSPDGGTPTGNDDRARAMIQALDLSRTLADVQGVCAWLAGQGRSTGRVGAVGFCWGGALADRLAVTGAPGLGAVVSFYGPAPPATDAAGLRVPIQLHYAGLDTRVAATAGPWIAALRAARKPFEAYDYPGVNHAFHNDASAERYDRAAATLAWRRTVTFLRRSLR